MEDLYNLLMRGIEPDLCTDTLPLLDTMYAGETLEERKERMHIYAEAFKNFLERYQQFCGALHGKFQKIQSCLRQMAEGKDQAKDSDVMANIEAFFRNA